jgi:DNA-binding CsgD family transcriptional regulator
MRNILDKLTPAERRVAIQVLQGLSTKEISTQLGRAEATIKHQVRAVLKKTGTPSRGRLMALCYGQIIHALTSADRGSDGVKALQGVPGPTAGRERRTFADDAAGSTPRRLIPAEVG